MAEPRTGRSADHDQRRPPMDDEHFAEMAKTWEDG